MNAKLTLYGKKDIADEIKMYAKLHNTSVSKMVFEFFENILQKSPIKEKKKDLPPITESLQGVLKGKYPDDVDFKEVYHKCLEEKYL